MVWPSDLWRIADQFWNISVFQKDLWRDVRIICARSSALEGESRNQRSSNALKRLRNFGRGSSWAEIISLLSFRPNSEISCSSPNKTPHKFPSKKPTKRPLPAKIPSKLEKPSPCGTIEDSEISLGEGVGAICNPFGCQFRKWFQSFTFQIKRVQIWNFHKMWSWLAKYEERQVFHAKEEICSKESENLLSTLKISSLPYWLWYNLSTFFNKFKSSDRTFFFLIQGFLSSPSCFDRNRLWLSNRSRAVHSRCALGLEDGHIHHLMTVDSFF